MRLRITLPSRAGIISKESIAPVQKKPEVYGAIFSLYFDVLLISESKTAVPQI